MAEVIKTTVQLRRGLAATWAKNNPVLAYGEPGFEKDTYRLKIGDGTTPWNDLGYLNAGSYMISPDGKSVTLSDGLLALYGFAGASVGQFPVKGEDGKLKWVDRDQPLSETEIREIIDQEEENRG